MSSEDAIKDDVLKQLGDQIKALQLKLFNEVGDDKESSIKCNDIHVKCLFDVLDHILLYGLKNPENGYWIFVSQFTHPEVKKDIDENPDVHSVFDKGRLWIYLALLDCLLGSYFRMFYDNQKTPGKYYQRDSFIRDKERLGIIITLVAGLDLIRLPSQSDLSFLGFRDVGLTNIIESSPASQNGKKSLDVIQMQSFPDSKHSDINSHDIITSSQTRNGNNIPTDQGIYDQTADDEQDDVVSADDTDGGTGSKMRMPEGSYLDSVDWLSIKKPLLSENGTASYENQSDCGDSFDEFCRNNDHKSTDSNDVINESTISIVEAEFGDESLPKVSEVNHNPIRVSEGSSFAEYEGIVLAGFPRRPGLSETFGTSSDVLLTQPAIEELGLNIFEDKDEKFHRFVQGFTGFHFGQLHAVHLLLTDKALYFLRKKSSGSYIIEQLINFQELKQMEIGVNCQCLAFVVRNETYSFSTANEAVTRSLVSDISSLVARSLTSPAQLTRLVSSTAVQGQSAIKKWLRHAMEDQAIDMEVLCFSLVHWMCFSGPGSELDNVGYQIIKEGYLECKSKYLGVVSHWERNYFALTGRGLLHYARQGDKVPKMIYELNASNCGGCRRVTDDEQRFAFEIISDDGQSVVILSSSSEDQASDWIMKFCQIVAGSSEFLYTTLCPAARAIPCCVVVTKTHVVTFHAHINGEYRLLSSFFIQDITQILVDNEVRNYCILKFEADHEGMWFFSFTTEYELSKFEHVVAEAWKDSIEADLQFYIIGEGPTRQRARDMSQYIQSILHGTS